MLAVLAGLGWFVLFGRALVETRSAPVVPGPPTSGFRPEPPAVVALLVNRWRLPGDAVGATMLDLAARGYLAFDGPTTCRVVRLDGTGLVPYERRVLARVASLAGGGTVAVTALAARSTVQERAWWRGFGREVAADARDRGLARDSWPRSAKLFLELGAVLVGVCVFLAAFVLGGDFEEASDRAGFLTWVGLVGLVESRTGQRDTPAGRLVAARWLGVRERLSALGAASEVRPPDRTLAYATALGLAPGWPQALPFEATSGFQAYVDSVDVLRGAVAPNTADELSVDENLQSMPLPARPTVADPAGLITADDVAAALGVGVRVSAVAGGPNDVTDFMLGRVAWAMDLVRVVEYRTAGWRGPAVWVQVNDSPKVQRLALMRLGEAGKSVPGLGDRAYYTRGNAIVVHRGKITVNILLRRADGLPVREILRALAAVAVGRLDDAGGLHSGVTGSSKPSDHGGEVDQTRTERMSSHDREP